MREPDFFFFRGCSPVLELWLPLSLDEQSVLCATFSQGGQNVLGLIVTFAFGMALCATCFAGQAIFSKKFPLEEEEKGIDIAFLKR